MRRLERKNINVAENFDAEWQRRMARHHRPLRLGRIKSLLSPLERIYGDRPPFVSLLDLGCGISDLPSYALNHAPPGVHLKATGLDYSEWAMKIMRELDPRVEWIHGDVLRTPFDPRSFDLVIASHVIEHLEEPSFLLMEMARIAKYGGWLVVCTLVESVIEEDPFHLWAFTADDLLELGNAHGISSVRRSGEPEIDTSKGERDLVLEVHTWA